MKTITELKRLHRKLMKLKDTPEYWSKLEEFQGELKEFTSGTHFDEFLSKASKNNVFILIAWCSSYRPREPHIILSKIGSAAKT